MGILQLVFAFLVTGILFGACSLSGPLRSDPRAARYEFGKLPADWKNQKSSAEEAGPDEFFQNEKTQSLISLNSMCRRYPDSSLETLMKQLFSPLSEVEVLENAKTLLDEREALLKRVKGKLDGVDVEAEFIIMRKNECLFDFSLISRNSITSDDRVDFEKFYRAFRYLGGVKEE